MAYFTIWLETVPLKVIKSQAIIKFIQEYIFNMFSIPESITTNQGTIFGEEVKDFLKEMKVKMIHCTPYYA